MLDPLSWELLERVPEATRNGAVISRLNSLLGGIGRLGYVSALDPRWGIVGDGTDEGAKWQKMLDANGRNITYLLPSPAVAYGVGSTVVLTSAHDGVKFQGVGARLIAHPQSGHGAYVKRLSANPAFLVSGLSIEFDGVSFDCNGGTYGGPTVTYNAPATECQIRNGGFFNVPNASYAIDVDCPPSGGPPTNTNGTRMIFRNLTFVPSGTPIAGIRLPADVTATGLNGGDRLIIGCIAGAMPLADTSLGSTNTIVSGCDAAGFLFGATSAKTSYVGGRIVATTVSIGGSNHAIVGNTIACGGGGVVLEATSNGCIFKNNAMSAGDSVTDLGTGNEWDHPYNPAGVGHQVGASKSQVLTRAALAATAADGFVYLPIQGIGPSVPPAAHFGAPTWWVVNGIDGVPRLYTTDQSNLPYSVPLAFGGPVLATDDFNRADTAAPQAGAALGSNSLGAWTIGDAGDGAGIVASGALGIDTNKAYAFAVATDAHGWYELNTPAVLLTAQVTTTSVGNLTVGLLLGRVDASNYLIARFKVNSWALMANVGGARTELANGVCVLGSGVETYVEAMRWGGRVVIWVGGSLVNGYLVGATKVYDDSPAGLSPLTNATKHGLYIGGTASGERVDNWQARRL